MDIIKLENKGYRVVKEKIKKKKLDDNQLKVRFKEIYGKEPTVDEFRQYKEYNNNY